MLKIVETMKQQSDVVPQWLQLNIGLVRQNGSALPSARAVFAEIQPLIDRWRAAACLDCCFFMRKPPDIRLRFLMIDNLESAISELSSHLHRLQNQNAIEQFFFSDYDLEVERFGGLAAINVIHQYFDLDMTNWLILDQLSQQNLRGIPPEILLPTVFHDLFCCVFDDEVSVFKVWQRLEEFTWVKTSSITSTVTLLTIKELRGSFPVTEVEANILDAYSQAHCQFAEAFIQLLLLDLIDGDLHDILATTALFNFNRHGFPGERSSVIVAAMTRLLASR